MKQQLRSTLRTFCFLVEITEVMNDHEYICRSGKWELWAWHLGNCTAHGHEQHIPDLYTGIHWHQLSPGTADLLLEIRAKCHMQVLEVATLQENISFLFSCQGNEKTQWWKRLLWHEWKSVRLNVFKTKTKEFALQYTSFIQLWYH